jgi:hypothetical protein
MLGLVRHVCILKPKGSVAPVALQRGQATLPNLQIVLRTLEVSHGLGSRWVFAVGDYDEET